MDAKLKRINVIISYSDSKKLQNIIHQIHKHKITNFCECCLHIKKITKHCVACGKNTCSKCIDGNKCIPCYKRDAKFDRVNIYRSYSDHVKLYNIIYLIRKNKISNFCYCCMKFKKNINNCVTCGREICLKCAIDNTCLLCIYACCDMCKNLFPIDTLLCIHNNKIKYEEYDICERCLHTDEYYREFGKFIVKLPSN